MNEYTDIQADFLDWLTYSPDDDSLAADFADWLHTVPDSETPVPRWVWEEYGLPEGCSFCRAASELYFRTVWPREEWHHYKPPPGYCSRTAPEIKS